MQIIIRAIVGVLICSFLNIILHLSIWQLFNYLDEMMKRPSGNGGGFVPISGDGLAILAQIFIICLGIILGIIVGLIIAIGHFQVWQSAIAGLSANSVIVLLLFFLVSSESNSNKSVSKTSDLGEILFVAVFYIIGGAICGIITSFVTNFVSAKFFEKPS